MELNTGDEFSCGYVGIIGRPNVGKSTLLNQVLGQKISIISRKPQTTRHRILGIKTEENYQAIFVDTPGIHQAGKNAMNQYMNKTASNAMSDVDIILFLIDCNKWTPQDQLIVDRMGKMGGSVPIILVMNKVDRLDDKTELLAALEEHGANPLFSTVIPISAIKGDNIDALENEVTKYLPLSAPFYEADEVTTCSERFIVAELIREKLIKILGQELPYALTVEIELFKEKEKITDISAIIWVARKSQKAIVIGTKGEMLKSVGVRARKDIEKFLEKKVFLKLWVKVKDNWIDNAQALHSLGYHES